MGVGFEYLVIILYDTTMPVISIGLPQYNIMLVSIQNHIILIYLNLNKNAKYEILSLKCCTFSFQFFAQYTRLHYMSNQNMWHRSMYMQKFTWISISLLVWIGIKVFKNIKHINKLHSYVTSLKSNRLEKLSTGFHIKNMEKHTIWLL